MLILIFQKSIPIRTRHDQKINEKNIIIWIGLGYEHNHPI